MKVNPFSIPPFIVALMLLFLGTLVFLKGIKRKLNVAFFLFCLSACGWLLGYTLMYNQQQEIPALFWSRVGFSFIVLIPVFGFRFAAIFVEKSYPLLFKFLYLIAIVGVCLGWTPFVYKGVHAYFWGFYPVAGEAYILFLLMFGALFAFSLYLLWMRIREMTSKGDFIKVQQSKYILIAFLFGLTGAIDYVVKYNIEVYPWGYISALLLIGTIAYAIVRYRLMDIRVAVASTGIFLVVYFVALGVPFQLYRTGEHFLALVMAVILATVAPFIYSRLKNEAEKEILKGELDYQKALTLSIQQQLIESEKMATIGFLVGGLAHQLKNRFTSLVFFSDFASRKVAQHRDVVFPGADCDETLSYLGKIADGVHSSKEVVNGVLNYTSDREVKSEISMKDLVAATIDLIEFKIPAGSVIFENAIGDEVGLVKGNFAQLQEVFFNIIDNAYFAMMEKKKAGQESGYAPRIEFTASTESGVLQIKIKDNGMGIKPENMRKLFTPFFTTKAKSKEGTGLGLYVIRKIIEDNHGGKVEMRSVYGQGTEMVLRLATTSV